MVQSFKDGIAAWLRCFSPHRGSGIIEARCELRAHPIANMNTPVNEKAPVLARGSILIHAPLEVVWSTLTDIEAWPKWQKAVTAAQLAGSPEEGATFRWKAGGLRFVSRIHTALPMALFGWTGRTIGASAIHNWRFEPTVEGTRVQVEESLQGFFPTVLKRSFQRQLEQGIVTSLQELKEAAERRG